MLRVGRRPNLAPLWGPALSHAQVAFFWRTNFSSFFFFFSPSTRPIDSAVHRTHNRCRLSVEYPTSVAVDVVCDFEARRRMGLFQHGAIRAARVCCSSRHMNSLLGRRQRRCTFSAIARTAVGGRLSPTLRVDHDCCFRDPSLHSALQALKSRRARGASSGLNLTPHLLTQAEQSYPPKEKRGAPSGTKSTRASQYL